MKVLIVDDIEMARQNLKKPLEREGILCIEASTGEEAVQFVKSVPDIDIVILDLQMPDKDDEIESGLCALKEIVKINPNAKIIISTGVKNSYAAAKCISLGADYFVPKPNADKIAQCIIEYNKTTA